MFAGSRDCPGAHHRDPPGLGHCPREAADGAGALGAKANSNGGGEEPLWPTRGSSTPPPSSARPHGGLGVPALLSLCRGHPGPARTVPLQAPGPAPTSLSRPSDPSEGRRLVSGTLPAALDGRSQGGCEARCPQGRPGLCECCPPRGHGRSRRTATGGRAELAAAWGCGLLQPGKRPQLLDPPSRGQGGPRASAGARPSAVRQWRCLSVRLAGAPRRSHHVQELRPVPRGSCLSPQQAPVFPGSAETLWGGGASEGLTQLSSLNP